MRLFKLYEVNEMRMSLVSMNCTKLAFGLMKRCVESLRLSSFQLAFPQPAVPQRVVWVPTFSKRKCKTWIQTLP